MEQAAKRSGSARTPVSPWGLLTATGSIVAASTAAGFLGSYWWCFDLFAHFRAQYFWFSVTAAILCLLVRRWRASVCMLILAVVNGALLAPAYVRQHASERDRTNTHRAMLINVHTESRNFQKTEAAIKELDPDILVLQEISSEWLTALSNCLARYPHFETAPRDDNFGIGLFSKWPLVQSEVEFLNEAEVPTIFAQATLPTGQQLRVIATHPLPPGSSDNSRLRDHQLLSIARRVRDNQQPTLLLGDLNATPWSAVYRRLLRESGMLNSAKGRGIQPSWPTHFPPLLIPLDHCLHTSDITILKRSVGPRTGSDHLPVVVEFAFP